MSWFEFRNKNSEYDYDLILKKIVVGTPQIKNYIVEVPFSSNIIDYSNVNGPCFSNRTLEITVNMEGYYKEDLYNIYTEIQQWLLTSTFEKLRVRGMEEYYFMGKVQELSSLDEVKTLGNLTVLFNCLPWRYEEKECVTEATLRKGESISLINSYMPSIPAIDVSNVCNIEFDGKKVQLLKGENKNPDITFKEGENRIKLVESDSSVKFVIKYKKGGL